MLAIKNNLMAESAARQLGKNYDKLTVSVSHLSSGQRINSSGDDAAGLAVRELIRADIATLRQGSRNARDAISMLQTAEGAMSVVDDILIRMMELAEQAATESYSDAQRKIMDQEFSQLITEIDRIADNTDFNGQKLLDRETETFNIHLGSSETIDIGTTDVSASGLGIGGVKAKATTSAAFRVDAINELINVSAGQLTIGFNGTAAQTSIVVDFSVAASYTLAQLVDKINAESRATEDEEYDVATVYYDEETMQYGLRLSALWGSTENQMTVSFDNASIFNAAKWGMSAGSGMKISIADPVSAAGALNTVWEAIKTKDEFRAKMGYLMNRLQSAIAVVDIEAENLLAAESRISDVDVATEMAAMTRYKVLSQAGVSMLAQANTMPQMALQLLQG